MIAHSLALISNKYLDGKIDANRVAVLAIFHDASEIITGDMPTPVKYFSKEIKEAYERVEHVAKDRLLSMLPEEFKNDFKDIFYVSKEEEDLNKLVKAADTLSAYIKCLEELRAGNNEFKKAKDSIEEKLNEMNIPEVKIFLNEFIKGFSLPLDEQN
jgi:5'-deoxynucleotidase